MREKLAMIMEYAAEGSLRDYLTKHASTPLKKNMALSLVYDIAYGMKALYAKGVHHRDLKASNVLLDRDLHAKVCDFGLSKASVLQSAIASASKGRVVGTPAWQSPEEFNGDVLDDEMSGYFPHSPWSFLRSIISKQGRISTEPLKTWPCSSRFTSE